MENKVLQYAFSSKVYHYSTSVDMVGWCTVALPNKRKFQTPRTRLGRMKVTAKVGIANGKLLYGLTRNMILTCFH